MLNLSNKSSCYINVAESASGQAKANPGFWMADDQDGKMGPWP